MNPPASSILLEQLKEDEGRIIALETRGSAGNETIPTMDVGYSAAVLRLAFTYSDAFSITVEEASAAVVDSLDGREGHIERMVSDFNAASEEKKPWWKVW